MNLGENSYALLNLKTMYSGGKIFGGSRDIDIFGGYTDSESEYGGGGDSEKSMSEVNGGDEVSENKNLIIVPKIKKTTKKDYYNKLMKSYFI